MIENTDLSKDKYIYADNAATTRVDERVLKYMLPFLTDEYGNPSSAHKAGREAKKAVFRAREQVAKLINANEDEIVFTSCGTESANMAIKGVCGALISDAKDTDIDKVSCVDTMFRGGKNIRRRILVSSIEHPCVLNTALECEKMGFEFERVVIPVDSTGYVDIEALKRECDERTALICIMHANNETGVIQPVKECCEIAHENGALFLCDCVQSAGHINVDVKDIGCDFITISGHKLNAPKGIGALYIRHGIRLPALINGGGQEENLRSGTENVAYIAALGEACRIAANEMENGEDERIAGLRDYIQNKVTALTHVKVNGCERERVPGTLSMSIECVEGESVMLVCGVHGLCISTGSACANGKGEYISHVLSAMGLESRLISGSVRVSIGRFTTESDAERIADILCETVMKLRNLSAEWERIKQNKKAEIPGIRARNGA